MTEDRSLLVTAGRRRGLRGAIAVLAALAALAALAVAWALVTALRGHAGGDPGHRVLHRLLMIRDAVPAGASAVAVSAGGAGWTGAQPDCPGARSGWVEDLVSVRFDDPAAPATIEAHIAAVLAGQGWRRHDIATGPGQGRIAHWSRDISGGRPASSFAYPVPAGSHDWFMTATWQPPGPVASGCG